MNEAIKQLRKGQQCPNCANWLKVVDSFEYNNEKFFIYQCRACYNVYSET